MTSLERADTMTREEVAATLDEKDSLQERVDDLQRKIDWFNRQLFGEKSERQLHPDLSRQLSLGEGKIATASADHPDPAPQTPVAPHKRRKARSAMDVLTEGLRFDETVPMTIIELVDADMQAIPKDELVRIDEKRTYRLAQRPAAYEVVCYSRPVFKHRKTGEFFCAPAPASVLERSCADVSLLAGLLVDKLLYHLPLYRQHQRMGDNGVVVGRSSLTNWTQRAIDLLEPIHEAQLTSILDGRTLTMDETPIKAGRKGNGAGKGKMKRGYFWPVYGDQDEVSFLFAPTRARSVIEQTLDGFTGVLLTDGYGPYDQYASKTNDITHAGCWAHTRRKFIEAESAEPRLCKMALDHIGVMYKQEALILERGYTGKEKIAARAEHCRPLVEDFFEWLDQMVNEQLLLPSNPFLGGAAYAQTRRKQLTVFLDYPDLPVDTNHIEREIRPIALGRKNWMFCWTELGAKQLGIAQGLLRTCRLHGIDPYTWLVDVLQRVAEHPASRVDELTPRLWKGCFGSNPLQSDVRLRQENVEGRGRPQGSVV